MGESLQIRHQQNHLPRFRQAEEGGSTLGILRGLVGIAVEEEFTTSQAQLVAIHQAAHPSHRHLVDEGAVGAAEIHDLPEASLMQDAGVLPGDGGIVHPERGGGGAAYHGATFR